MPANPVRLLALACFCFLAPLASHGRQTSGSPGGTPPAPYTLGLSTAVGFSYTATTSGDYDGDGQQDLAYLLGAQVDVMLAPGLFEARLPDIGTSNDLATVPHSPFDYLLTVNASGLWRLVWEPLTQTWNSTLIAAADWAGAQALDTWVDANGQVTLFGLDASGTKIVEMHFDDTTGWTPGATIDTGSSAPFTHIAAFDYDGDGTPDVGAITTSLLSVYDPASATPSTPLTSGSIPGWSNTAITRIHHAGSSREWLGWIWTKLSDGTTQKFCTFGLEGTANVQGMGNGLDYYDLQAADMDADGDDDVVAVNREKWALSTIPNEGVPAVAPIFSGASLVEHVYATTSAATNQARPCIVDIDGDEDGDLCLPLQDESALWIHRNTTVDHTTEMPALIASDVSGVAALYHEANQELTFEIVLPGAVGATLQGDYLEVAVWSQPNPNTPVDPAAIYASRTSVAGMLGADTLTYNISTSALPVSSISQTGFESILYIKAQMIEAASPLVSEPASNAYPGLLVVLHGQDMPVPISTPRGAPAAGSNEDFVQQSISGQMQFEVGATLFSQGTGLDGGDDIGLGGAIPCLPLPPSQPPTP